MALQCETEVIIAVIIRQDETNYYLFISRSDKIEAISIPKRDLPRETKLGCWLNLTLKNGIPLKGELKDQNAFYQGEERNGEWVFIVDVDGMESEEIQHDDNLLQFFVVFSGQLIPLVYPGESFLKDGGKIFIKRNENAEFVSKYENDPLVQENRNKYNFFWIAEAYGKVSPVLKTNEDSPFHVKTNSNCGWIGLVTGTKPGHFKAWFIYTINGWFGYQTTHNLGTGGDPKHYSMGDWTLYKGSEDDDERYNDPRREVFQVGEMTKFEGFETKISKTNVSLVLPKVTIPKVSKKEIVFQHPDIGCIVDRKGKLQQYLGQTVDIVVTRLKPLIHEDYRLIVTDVITEQRRQQNGHISSKNSSSSSSSNTSLSNPNEQKEMSRNSPNKADSYRPFERRSVEYQPISRYHNCPKYAGSGLNNACSKRRAEKEVWNEIAFMTETTEEHVLWLAESKKLGYCPTSIAKLRQGEAIFAKFTKENGYIVCLQIIRKEKNPFQIDFQNNDLIIYPVNLKFSRTWLDYRIFYSQKLGDVIDVNQKMQSVEGEGALKLVNLPDFVEPVWVVIGMLTTSRQAISQALGIFGKMMHKDTRPLRDKIGMCLTVGEYDKYINFYEKQRGSPYFSK